MNLAIILILYIGGLNVNTGHLSSGEVVALINYMTQMLLALIVVANLVVIFTKAFASADRVNEVFNTEVTIETTEIKQTDTWQQTNLLTFEDVSFKYTDTSGYVLKNISFNLRKGDTLGITGPTGSGKSTLIDLIPHFYPITKGNILLNNRNMTEYETGDLRHHIATVSQKSVLFSGTIRSNLLMGNPTATEEDCYEALEVAQCLDFVITLPEKLDSPVLANGTNFSGGQRQRLSIARAFIKKPDLLIMDDSLSALDYQTDWLIREGISKKYADLTLIIISQRISSVKEANQILVLDNGEQVGLGTHQQLVQTSPVYQNIMASQEEEDTIND